MVPNHPSVIPVKTQQIQISLNLQESFAGRHRVFDNLIYNLVTVEKVDSYTDCVHHIRTPKVEYKREAQKKVTDTMTQM